MGTVKHDMCYNKTHFQRYTWTRRWDASKQTGPNLVLSPSLSLLAIKLKTTAFPLISQLNFMSPNFSHRKKVSVPAPKDIDFLAITWRSDLSSIYQEGKRQALHKVTLLP